MSIAWGDGSATPAQLDALHSTFTATHQYHTLARTDVFTITATVTDDDTGMASQTIVSDGSGLPVPPLATDARRP